MRSSRLIRYGTDPLAPGVTLLKEMRVVRRTQARRVSDRITRGLLLLVLASTTAPAHPAEGGPISSASDSRLGARFLSGAEAHVEALNAADEDIFAAADNVVIEDAVVDDVFAAGRTVLVTRSAVDDVATAGDDVTLNAVSIADDVVVAANVITVDPKTTIKHNAVLAARRATLQATIGGTLIIAAQTVELAGSVAGDATIYAETIIFGPDARIDGDLRYADSTEFVGAAPENVVGGRIDATAIDPVPEVPSSALTVARPAAWAGTIIGLVVLAIGLVALLPGLFVVAAGTLTARPGRSLLLGIAMLAAWPVVAVILVATVVGLLLALAGLALYAAALAGALCAAALWLGDRGLAMMRRSRPWRPSMARRLGTAALGMLGLTLLGAIPFLGPLIVMGALAGGLGALTMAAWGRLRQV